MRVIKDTVQRKWLQLGTLALTSFSIYSFILSQQLRPATTLTRSLPVDTFANSSGYKSLKRLVDNRVLHQRDVCKNALHKTISKDLKVPQLVRERLIVDESRKLIYCPIPKAGSSNWKRIFVKLLNPEFEETEDLLDIRGVHHIELPTLSSFSPSQQAQFLKSFEKFVWVRHPFERILSAFHNKLEHPFSDEFQMRYGRKIVKNFRPHASEDSLDHGNDVSITEFIKYLVKTGLFCAYNALAYAYVDPAKFNNHWMRYWDLCAPCHVNYDFIGTAENYADEAALFVNRHNINVTFPEHEARTTIQTSLGMWVHNHDYNRRSS